MTIQEIKCDLYNKIASTIEQAMWLNNPPRKYFAYVNAEKKTLTTWTGEKLGDINFINCYSCPAFGGYTHRVSIRVKGTNGAWYSGTYYKSSGDYARITLTAKKGW